YRAFRHPAARRLSSRIPPERHPSERRRGCGHSCLSVTSSAWGRSQFVPVIIAEGSREAQQLGFREAQVLDVGTGTGRDVRQARWLAAQSFAHPAQQIVFQDGVATIEDAVERRRRLEDQLASIVPGWSMAPVVAGSYRHPARVSDTQRTRLEALPKAVAISR